MSVIWLIEDHRGPGTHLARILMGNFAVRLFGSLKSFLQLAKMEKDHKPNILIINVDPLSLDIRQIDQSISRHFPCVPKLYFLAINHSIFEEKYHTHLLPKNLFFYSTENTDDLEIAGHVRYQLDALSKTPDPRTILKYKDIYLDFDKNRVGTIPGTSDGTDLTLTESRILRLLIVNRGKCLTRERIQKEVWCGAKVSPRTIDSHVSRLRKHLSYSESTIESVYGGGYLLK